MSASMVQLPLPLAVHLPSTYSSSSSSLPSSSSLATLSGTSLTPPFEDTFTKSLPNDSDTERLPPYTLDTELPLYTPVVPTLRRVPEPATITMYLFIGGFVFPLLWAFGGVTLKYTMYSESADCSYAPWVPDKANTAQHVFMRRRREAEITWAKRCIWALAILICIGVAVGMSVWGALSSEGRGTGALS